MKKLCSFILILVSIVLFSSCGELKGTKFYNNEDYIILNYDNNKYLTHIEGGKNRGGSFHISGNSITFSLTWIEGMSGDDINRLILAGRLETTSTATYSKTEIEFTGGTYKTRT